MFHRWCQTRWSCRRRSPFRCSRHGRSIGRRDQTSCHTWHVLHSLCQEACRCIWSSQSPCLLWHMGTSTCCRHESISHETRLHCHILLLGKHGVPEGFGLCRLLLLLDNHSMGHKVLNHLSCFLPLLGSAGDGLVDAGQIFLVLSPLANELLFRVLGPFLPLRSSRDFLLSEFSNPSVCSTCC